MIWLLLIFFVPGGLNQNILTDNTPYIIAYPCDDTNISAVMKSPNPYYPDHYNLLIPTPTWGFDLILTFITNTTLENEGYFDNLGTQKSTVVPDIASSAMSNASEEKTDAPHIVSSTMSNASEENNDAPYIVSSTMSNASEEKNDAPYIVSSTMSNASEEKTDAPYIVSSAMSNASEEITDAPYIVSSTMSNASEEKTDAPYIVSSAMSNASEEKSDAPHIVSSTMSNASEEQVDAPNIVSSMMSNAVFSSTPNVSYSKEFSPDESCGKQKVVHTELIVHGQSANSGQWPWHAAIFRIEQHSLRYICGGTLLSTTLVLTAAHCASIRGSPVVPDALKVHLGKTDLFSGDKAAQEREVFQVIVHHKFDGFTLDNDIALLKLKSEASITDYIRPACLWYEQANLKFPIQLIFGTIAGWGFDHHDLLTSTLRQITIPIVPELDCLKSNPTFFHKKLNHNKFCGGFANGTSVCNGDSGGGFMIFVPDAPGTATGAWHVRGIVSLAPSRTDALICDPYEYTIFTDLSKYQDWVLEYME